jgi:hypothetical protein
MPMYSVRLATLRPKLNGDRRESDVDLIWIVVIVLVVLALLGYFGRGRFR